MIRGKIYASPDVPAEVFDLRRRVFGDEFHAAQASERDAGDEMAVYMLALDEADAPSSTGRLRVDEMGHFVIDRVCTLAAARGKYLGDLVMRMLLYRALELGAPGVYLTSPVNCAGFFARYGLSPLGSPVEGPLGDSRLMYASAEEINLQGTCGGKSACAGCVSDCASCPSKEG